MELRIGKSRSKGFGGYIDTNHLYPRSVYPKHEGLDEFHSMSVSHDDKALYTEP